MDGAEASSSTHSIMAARLLYARRVPYKWEEYTFLSLKIPVFNHHTLNRQTSSRQYRHQPLSSIGQHQQIVTRSRERSPTFIWLALLPELTGGLNSRFASVFMQIYIAHDFTANKFVFEIGVNDASRLWRLRSLADGPGTNFIRSTSEIPN